MIQLTVHTTVITAITKENTLITTFWKQPSDHLNLFAVILTNVFSVITFLKLYVRFLQFKLLNLSVIIPTRKLNATAITSVRIILISVYRPIEKNDTFLKYFITACTTYPVPDAIQKPLTAEIKSINMFSVNVIRTICPLSAPRHF